MSRSRRSKRRGRGRDGPNRADAAGGMSLTGGLIDGLPAWRVRMAFDAAKTTDLNRRHWMDADDLSADAAASPDVRSALRIRARHEVANNSYAKGITLTLANDVIGTGPRLQLLTDDEKLNRRVEADFSEWAVAVKLAEKLRTVKFARVQDGEAFLLIAHDASPYRRIPLDLHLFEADRVASPLPTVLSDPRNIDGVLLDDRGRPKAYQVLVEHPGSRFGVDSDFVVYNARDMVHIFREDRPGQHRGIPEITPAIPLFAQLRRFTLAVLSAAESAADWAAILYTDTPADGEATPINPMEKINLHRNAMLTMPAGWKMGQLDPKQPASTYAEFKKELLNEIARCLNMPFNIATANSSGYNYASGRLDHQTYFKSIRVDQNFTGIRVLDPILSAWLAEYAAFDGGVSARLARGGRGVTLPHQWFWDGLEHVDPLKEANAAAVRLAHGIGSIPSELARSGDDYETSMRGAAKALGVTVKQYQALVRQKTFGTAALPEDDGAEPFDDPEEEPYAQ